jgi:hypothetical protein
LAVAIAGAVGCGKDGLELAPVEGVVLLEGRPVADAGVVFAPVDSKQGLPAVGTTDAEGKFTLITANRPGAALGEHRVAISKTESIAIPQRRGLPLYEIKEHLPVTYGSLETSGLTATVTEDDNHPRFELSSK